MKLKTKLIPIIASASVAATAAPITLTSCGHRYTDMLYQYQTGVKPFMKTTFEDCNAASRTYEYRVKQNPDVIRDDVLFSISSIFNNKTTRAKIDQIVEFTRYDLDFTFYTEKDKIDETMTYVNLVIWLDIAGKGKNLKIGEKNVGEFDLSMELVLYHVDSLDLRFETDDDDRKVIRGNDALKDYYLIFMPLSASVAEITTKGTCEGLSTESKNEYNHHVIFDDSFEEASSVEEYNLFKTSLFTLSFIDSNIDPTVRTHDGILFGSHYFKDVTILYPEE